MCYEFFKLGKSPVIEPGHSAFSLLRHPLLPHFTSERFQSSFRAVSEQCQKSVREVWHNSRGGSFRLTSEQFQSNFRAISEQFRVRLLSYFPRRFSLVRHPLSPHFSSEQFPSSLESDCWAHSPDVSASSDTPFHRTFHQSSFNNLPTHSLGFSFAGLALFPSRWTTAWWIQDLSIRILLGFFCFLKFLSAFMWNFFWILLEFFWDPFFQDSLIFFFFFIRITLHGDVTRRRPFV